MRKDILNVYVSLIYLVLFFPPHPLWNFDASAFDLEKTNDLGDRRFRLSVNNGSVSLDATGADLRKILEALSIKSGVKIEVDHNVQANITITSVHLDIEQFQLVMLVINFGEKI